MMAGCLLAVVCYLPIYNGMVHYAGNNVAAIHSVPDVVTGEPKITPVTADNQPAAAATAPNVTMLTLLIFIQMLFVTMVYAPIAAYLVEAFPAKIRYTSMSLPYHIGNGVFGGLLPTIGLFACAYTGNIYAGLVYPMIVAGITFLIGTVMLPETHNMRMWDEFNETNPNERPI
jgi:MFS family permease